MKIAIFDMDGTLLNSAKDITISINAIRSKNYGLENLSEEFVIEAINAPVRNLAKLFYETEVYADADRKLFEKHYYEQCVKNVYLYDGVKEILQSLKEEGVKLSVATNAPTIFAKRMLKECKVDDLFDVIIGADKVQNPKPHKQMLEFILNKYDYTDADLAVMIGDNSKDMDAASNAGIKSLFATWGFSPMSTFKDTISHPKDIIKFFKKKNKIN